MTNGSGPAHGDKGKKKVSARKSRTKTKQPKAASELRRSTLLGKPKGSPPHAAS